MDNFENYDATNNNDVEENPILRLNADDMADICRRLSGLKFDGSPKVSVSYCAYDFEAPEDDPDKDTIYFADITRAELSLDKMTGFYVLDLSFKDAEDPSLKLMWARLQKHKSNETYLCDKTWIFFIKLIEDEESAEGTAFAADILNPLVFYLIRRVPNEDVSDYEVEPGVFTGGNTIRFLLHRDLVTFQYEDVPSDEDQDEYTEEDDWKDENDEESDSY